MRMILHSYKNMFLSVKQFSDFALKSIDPHGGQVDEMLEAINNLSGNALYQIVHQLEMLGTPNIVYKVSNINNIIYDTLKKHPSPKTLISAYIVKNPILLYILMNYTFRKYCIIF